MKPLFIDEGEGGVKHIIYDLSLPLHLRKSKAIVFATTIAAANFLGVTPKKIYHNRTPGKKIIGRDGKPYAVRIYHT